MSLIYLFTDLFGEYDLFICLFTDLLFESYLFIYGFFGESDLFICIFIYLRIYWLSLIYLFTDLLGESDLFIYLSIYIFLSFPVCVNLLTSASLYSLLRSLPLRLQTGLTHRLYSDLYRAFHNVLRDYKHL